MVDSRSRREARRLPAALVCLAAGLGRVAVAQDVQPPDQQRPDADPRSVIAAPAEADTGPAPAPATPPGAPAGSQAEPMISFSAFAEPISISALIDFIADQLGVIIMQTDAAGLASATVEFSAPIDVPRSQLMALLESLLAPKGFVISRTPEGIYTVSPVASATVDFSEGEFSPTRVIRTPLLTPSGLQQAISTTIGSTGAKLVYLDELGLLISTAPSRVNNAIEALVQRMTQEIASQELHRIELTHIAAAEAKSRVLELTGQAVQQAPAAGQNVQGAATPAASRAGQLGNLRDRLLIDRPTNALVFRGSAEEAEQVRRFIAIVDQPARLIVRRYYAGPTAAEICQVGSRQGLGPIMQTSGGAGGASRAGGSGGIGAGFALSGNESESFTYYGTDSQHQQVQALVDEFAEQSREETFVVEFYKLRDIAAEDAADLLTQLMETDTERTAESPFLPGSQRDRTQQRGFNRLSDAPVTPPTRRAQPDSGAGAPPETGAPGEAGGAGGQEGATLTPAEGVSVIADVPNNQIIIRAPRRQQREFARIIERLDQRRAQVYLDVQIVSVNASKDFNFSVDTALTSPNSDVPVFTNFGLVPFGSVLAIPNSTQGVTAAVIRNDYTAVVINALTTVGEGELISSPKLLISDNEEATVASTRDEPFASTSQGQATSITSTGGTLSAGTTLTARPTISSGNAVRLEYSVELSSFGERPSPDLPPVRNSDTFNSIVSVPANSTVVVGGLTFYSRDKTVSKVPFLGSVPLLGLAFQSQSRMLSKRTVYVFITPRILRDESFQDLRLLTRGPRHATGVEDVTPELTPAVIPVIESKTGSGA